MAGYGTRLPFPPLFVWAHDEQSVLINDTKSWHLESDGFDDLMYYCRCMF